MAQDVTASIDTADIAGGNSTNDRSDHTDAWTSAIAVFNAILNGTQEIDTLFMNDLGTDPSAPTGNDILLYNNGGVLYQRDVSAISQLLATDAADVGYTPTTLADWDSGADPGGVVDALDQLAQRATRLEDHYILLEEQQPQNTSAGGFTLGAWRNRVLNTKVSDPGDDCSILYLAFTSGSVEPVWGDVITGATSLNTATIISVELTSGSWAGADAAGNLWIDNQSGAFVAENLNNTTQAQSNFATIAADSTNDGQFRLRAGTYVIEASAPAHRVDAHQTDLYDATNTVVIKAGTSEKVLSAGAPTTRSFVKCRLTAASDTTYILRHQCQTTRATDGMGIAVNFTTEVYAQVSMQRVA